MEKTAIELLKETRKFLNEECRPLDYHYVNELVNAIDAYLSSPPSERAMEVAMRIYYDCFLMGNRKFEAEQAAREIEAFGQRVMLS